MYNNVLNQFEKFDPSFEKEKEVLRNTNPKIIINNIKSTIDIIINNRIEEALKNVEINEGNESLLYEKELRHLEATIRKQIQVLVFFN